MQRERSIEHDPTKASVDQSLDSDNLAQQRAEIDSLLQAADHIFDSINNLHAQQYLDQNLQTGGQ